jgi:hypothetical protein
VNTRKLAIDAPTSPYNRTPLEFRYTVRRSMLPNAIAVPNCSYPAIVPESPHQPPTLRYPKTVLAIKAGN